MTPTQKRLLKRYAAKLAESDQLQEDLNKIKKRIEESFDVPTPGEKFEIVEAGLRASFSHRKTTSLDPKKVAELAGLQEALELAVIPIGKARASLHPDIVNKASFVEYAEIPTLTIRHARPLVPSGK